MLTIQELLRIKSDLLDRSAVKLVRHKDSRVKYRDIIQNHDALLEYQSIQPKDVFKGCDYIVSFIGQEQSKSLLFGVFKVNNTIKKGHEFHYDLERVEAFEEFAGRAVINWGPATRNWHQWYDIQPKSVVELLPQGYLGHFPGLLEFVLTFDELKKLIANPDANRDWKTHLASVNGIYMILDECTGKQYIGSANGKEGIWQRWSEYVATYAGGNKELIQLLQKDPQHYRHFKYSVLQSLPSNITQREIVAIENLYKQKLGTRAYGLNKN